MFVSANALRMLKTWPYITVCICNWRTMTFSIIFIRMENATEGVVMMASSDTGHRKRSRGTYLFDITDITNYWRIIINYRYHCTSDPNNQMQYVETILCDLLNLLSDCMPRTRRIAA